MPPSQQPRERIGTPFDHGDQLDLHMSSLERLAADVDLAYEPTPDARTGRVDGATVMSLVDRQTPLPEAVPTQIEQVQIDVHNLMVLRQRVASGIILPLQARNKPLSAPASVATSSQVSNREDFTLAT